MNRLMRMIALGVGLLTALPGQALATKIVVDPGHGGKDPGAHGVNGLNESEVNLDIAYRLRDELVRRGYEVAMTRMGDTYVSLADRVDFTNLQEADLFVSVHANWYKNPNTQGTMVLYYDDSAPQAEYPASEAMTALTPESRTLAQRVLDSFVGGIGTGNLGLTKSAVYVVRMGSIPSVLVETAFLSNASDAVVLADPGVRLKMAVAIERGIEGYKLPGFADLTGHWARDAVLRLKERGIVEGVGSRYQPDRPMTRAEFVTMLDRAFKLPAPCGTATGGSATGGSGAGAVYGATVGSAVYGGAAETGASNSGSMGASAGCGPAASGSAGFGDVTPKHWAYASLQKAAASGLLQGYPDGTLRPDSQLKRAEAAALLKRFGGAALSATPQPGTAAAFADVPGTYWAAGEIAALAGAGVVTGVKDARFMPERLMTRAEMAVMLDRYLSLRK